MDALRSSSRSILILLIGGIALRFLLAYVLLPNAASGDVRAYVRWAMTIAEVGPGAFYAKAGADYPPGYLYVLWVVGEASQSIASLAGSEIRIVARWLVKLPPILLDACAAFMIFKIAQSGEGDRQKAAKVGLFAAALYLLNPVTVYDSAIWGQTDVAGVCVLLAAFISLTRGPAELSVAIAVLGALIKPQFGVILAPLVGAVLLRRHLVWEGGRDGPVRLLTSALVGAAVFYGLAAPFNLGLSSFFERMVVTANQYPYLSVNAFNPWALVGSGETPPLTFAGLVWGTAHWSRDDIPILGSISGVTIGSAVLALGVLIGVARLAWRADRVSILLVGIYLCMCFFMLPTRVHERYMFPVFAFLPLLAAMDRKWFWAIAALTLAQLINIHGVLTVAVRLPLGEPLRSPAGILISILLHTAVFLFVIVSMRPSPQGLPPLATEQARIPS